MQWKSNSLAKKYKLCIIDFEFCFSGYDLYNGWLKHRWLPAAPNGLPESMKHIYRITVDFYDKLEEKLEKEGRSGCGFHLKESVKTKIMINLNYNVFFFKYVFKPNQFYII